MAQTTATCADQPVARLDACRSIRHAMTKPGASDP